VKTFKQLLHLKEMREIAAAKALHRLIILECARRDGGRFSRLRDEFIARNKAECAERLARFEARRMA